MNILNILCVYTYTHTYFNDSDQLAGSIAFYLKLKNHFCWLVSENSIPMVVVQIQTLVWWPWRGPTAVQAQREMLLNPANPAWLLAWLWDALDTVVAQAHKLLSNSVWVPGQVIFFFWLSKCQPKWSTPSPEAYHKRQFSPGTHGPEPYRELWIQLGTHGPSRYQKESTR